ncbi:MAG: hypothetical protein AVDCRST_MAG18-4091, partial [uncultured Thermomicrobiales bacterium]
GTAARRAGEPSPHTPRLRRSEPERAVLVLPLAPGRDRL